MFSHEPPVWHVSVGIFNFTPCYQIKAWGPCWAVTGHGVVCSSTLGSCVNHLERLSSHHPRGVLLLTDGITVEPQNYAKTNKTFVFKASG